MIKKLAVSSIVAVITLGVPAMAWAGGGHHGGGHHGGGHGKAPEPVTILGLALGAGGIAVARAASRKRG
jgi:hypothetical protein